jgi:guanylate kinase
MMSPETLPSLAPQPQPLFIVLSGLSGVGKDTVLDGLRRSGLPLHIGITATTRPRRSTEREGADYYFVSREKFQQMIDGNELLEWATVYGNRYGIPRGPVRQALNSGRDVVVRIDVQGAATIKKILPGAVLIFLVTPTMGELEKRLRQRHTENPQELELRLKTAAAEMGQMSLFDYVVVNHEGEVERAVKDVLAIISAEKCRIVPRTVEI